MEEYSDYNEFGEGYEEMEPYTVKNAGLKYGLYLGVVSIVLSVVVIVLHLEFNQLFSIFVPIALTIVALVFAYREFKNENEGFMSLGEAIGIGMLIFMISAMISAVFSIFYTTVIDPTYMEGLIESMRQRMETEGNMKEEEIETMISWTRKFSTPVFTLLGSAVRAALGGLILSSIIGAIMKNKRPMF